MRDQSSLAVVDIPLDLAVIDSFRAAVDRITDPSELKNARDRFAMAEHAVALRGESRAAQYAWSELKLRVERKLGAMLADLDLHKGGRPPKTGAASSPVYAPTLDDLKITKK